MRISKFKLKNYVSFYDEKAQDVELGPGINFIVGKNNSGKTALLDALCLDRLRAPHRSIETISERDDAPSQPIDYEVELDFERGKLLSVLRNHAPETFISTWPPDKWSRSRRDHVLQSLLSDASKIRVYLAEYRVRVGDSQVQFQGIPDNEQTSWSFSIGGDFNVKGGNTGTSYDPLDKHRPQTCWEIFLQYILRNTFRFDAERQVNRKVPLTPTMELEPDSSNLAQVLRTAKDERPHRYEQYESLVKYIFPSICEFVSRVPSEKPVEEDDYLHIYIGYYERSLEREDLRVPLMGCGTGLAQVLSLLYVVVMSDEPRIILIDEPHSFLHPDAVRKLLSIFQRPEYSHHQYILTTHSPTAIMSVPRKTMVLLEHKNMKSEITTIDLNSNDDLRKTLEAVGTRPSDVFGMDTVIWVEGKTDESCLPLILEEKEILLGNARFLALDTTSNLTGRNASKVLQIYQKLSQGGLLPRALAFVFDGDSNDKVDCDKRLTVEVDNRQHKVFIGCLKRRNFESYFLDSKVFTEAVSAILHEKACRDHAKNYSSDAVQSWIDQNRAGSAYFKGRDKGEEAWLRNINGAKFIEDMFSDLSHHTLEYDKHKHGKRITAQILEAESDHFQEIVDLIKPLLENNSQTKSS